MATVVTRFLNRCIWLATSGGTGSFVQSAAVAGFQTMAAAGAVNAAVYGYAAQSADLSQWEVGTGTWTSATSTLTRTVLFNSLGTNAAVNFTAAPQVMITAIADTLVGFDSGFSYGGGGQVTLGLGTLAASANALTITGTWNNAAVQFDAPLFMNITNTASSFGSMLMDLRVGGATNLSVIPGSYTLYNNPTDTSPGDPVNFESGNFDWTINPNVLTIGTYSGGTGVNRPLNVLSSIGVGLYLGTPLVAVFSDGSYLALPNGWFQWGGQARVTSDFSVTSSTTLVNVTGLAVNLQAGRTYQFETELYVTDAAAGGVQAAIAGTATATAIQYTGYTIADNAIKGKTNATALAVAVGSTVTTETSAIIVRITGIITVNVAGTLTVQMAQNTSNGTATIAKRGSWFIVNDMP